MSERLMILGSFQGADSPTVGPITVREAVVREPTLPDVVAWLKENADVKDTAATKRLNADGRFTWQVPDMDGPGRYLVVCLPDETP